ncbi:hypothetical protein OS493_037605 [Desmophyllum pertusum]|uniref:Uncharacterized protein n=1 Tax=Desmophyllum pertusum TaxID=174260 RepID=A0A9W9ZV56_9CNID|nr:hypothetical protein OS493_037605 [Desmophyllum pertusum]
MDDQKTRTLSRSPTRKHLQSTFPSMMVDYMSGDELSKHLGRQMSIHDEKYKEPEEELDEAKEKRKLKRKASKLKKQQSHHGVILQRSADQKLSESVKTTKQSEEEDLPDDEEQENIRKMKEKAHDELVQGLLLLRDYYKAEYKKALQDKVDHQRRNLQQRQSKLEEETKMSEQDQQEMEHKICRKLPKSILVNDVQFKNGLQTDYYKIISLENQLKKEGFLNKTHEIKEFWDFITVPENLETVLEDGQLSWERIKTYHKEHTKASLATQGEIDTTVQQPKPGRKNKLKGAAATSSWRSTTHGIRTILTPSTPPSEIASGGRKSSLYVSSSRYRAKKTPPSTAIPIEQRFPKVEFPPLAAYRLEFGEPEPDPEEVRKQDEAYKRLQARNGLKRTLTTMFSHALANRAATQRLIDKNEDYNFESLSGASNMDEFHDLASVQLKPSGSASKKQQSRISSTKSKDGKSRVGSHKSASRRTKSPESESPDRSDSSMSLSSKEDLVVELPPLTLNQLSPDCNTKEAKCLSTFWVNPMAKRDFPSYEEWNSGIVS